jgi:BirA family biotin operon repressor/biotin-[acetyl-CoA-carboxylase] ligase
MESKELFSILDSVDSTNNYAMARVHEGLASHGQAWFSAMQTAGKGQREKKWYSRPGENIAISIAMQPGSLFQGRQFLFNAFIACECYLFFKKYAGENVRIKWPNDLYWRDRKAGGILIENNMQASQWNWAIVGIGLNINQENFPPDLPNPVSLKQITGKPENISTLAMELHSQILSAFSKLSSSSLENLIPDYNRFLYKKNEEVKLRKNRTVFTTTIKSVNEFGQLLTHDAIERRFDFGEVEWI